MKIKYGGMSEEGERKHGKIKYFAGAALLAAGLMIGTGHDNKEATTGMPVTQAAAAIQKSGSGGCESVFTESAGSKIERKLNEAVRSHSTELKGRIGSDEAVVVNFSIGVDAKGQVHVQDAWTIPESNLSARDIADITRLRFDDIRLEAPASGNMCSYSMPVVINQQS